MDVIAGSSLSRNLARRIIEQVGSSGQPSEEGLQYFSVGLEPFLNAINNEYLDDYIKNGGAAFKMVVGAYGSGKTHFLYSVRYQAWKRGYTVAYISLKSSGESPFYALDLVYKAIARAIDPPPAEGEREQRYHHGIGALLRSWYDQRYNAYLREGMSAGKARENLRKDIESLEIGPSISFGNAVRAALMALHRRDSSSDDTNDDSNEAFNVICQWLLGEGFDSRIHKQYGIQQKIDRKTALEMIRSLGQTTRALGYTGLVLLLDEAERIPSLSSRNREQHLSNLRELIDECSQSTFAGIMIFYAVPDETFLTGRTHVYEALVQRLSTVFNALNPTGVKILLEGLIDDPVKFLCQVGQRLAWIYETAYAITFNPDDRNKLIREIAEWARRAQYGDEGYKRLFVQKLIQGLGILHREGRIPRIDELK